MKSCVLAVVSVSAVVVCAPAAAQPRLPVQTTPGSGSGSAPVTTGRPDLDGVWTYGTATPFERPASFADKPTITEQEAEALRRQIEAERRAITAKQLLPMLNWGDRDRGFLTRRGRVVTSVIQDPPDGRVPVLTDEARRRSGQLRLDRADSAQDRSLTERCIRTVGWPPLDPGSATPYIQIFQTAEVIALVQEETGARLVRVGGGEAEQWSMPRWLGHSRGRWEGDTLVVETTHFKDQFAQVRVRNRFDGNLRLIERFTLDGPSELRYEFVVEDPTVLISSWGGVLTMRRMDSGAHEWACHEGNYSLPNILRGARVQEGTDLR